MTENYTLKDDLSKSWRAHNFKMGYELLRYHNNANSGPGNVDGTFNYGQSTNNTAGSGVGGLQPNGSAIANTGGIALAQFLTGDINGFSFGQNTDNLYTRSWEHSVYFQDDWRVSKTLTLNLGLRYEVEPPKTYENGYLSLFNLNLPDNNIYTGATPWVPFCGTGGCMGAYTHPKNGTPFDTDWHRFDPTVGLAWNFSPKMVVHAGARISHIDTFSDPTSLIFNNELLAKSYSVSQVSGNYAPLFNLNNGIPAWKLPGPARGRLGSHGCNQRRIFQSLDRPEKHQNSVCRNLEHRRTAGSGQELARGTSMGRLRGIERFRKHQYQHTSLWHNPRTRAMTGRRST